jgi:hypothetical protein
MKSRNHIQWSGGWSGGNCRAATISACGAGTSARASFRRLTLRSATEFSQRENSGIETEKHFRARRNCEKLQMKNPMNDFPNDADGDALRKIRDSGSDMSKPHVLDFYLCFADENMARFVATILPSPVTIDEISKEDDGRWTCFCKATLIPTYDAIVSVDRILEELCQEHGGDYEGWGTFGVH